MFKNRTLQVKMVKDSALHTTPESAEDYKIKAYTRAATLGVEAESLVRNSAKAVIVIIGAVTLSKIAVHTAETFIK